MPLHLIGASTSTCTQRVLMVLAEKGITDYTLYAPNFLAGEHKVNPGYLQSLVVHEANLIVKQPPHTNKQPFGVVPVLEDGDFTLFESRAICRYIASKFGIQGTKLTPDPNDAEATAIFEQWASVEVYNFDFYANPLVDQKLFVPMRGQTTILEVVDLMTTKLTEKLDIYEQVLTKQNYMGGNEFSLIDIFYMPYTFKLFQVGDGKLITDRPHVNAWWELVSNRETWKNTIATKA